MLQPFCLSLSRLRANTLVYSLTNALRGNSIFSIHLNQSLNKPLETSWPHWGWKFDVLSFLPSFLPHFLPASLLSFDHVEEWRILRCCHYCPQVGGKANSNTSWVRVGVMFVSRDKVTRHKSSNNSDRKPLDLQWRKAGWGRSWTLSPKKDGRSTTFQQLVPKCWVHIC